MRPRASRSTSGKSPKSDSSSARLAGLETLESLVREEVEKALASAEGFAHAPPLEHRADALEPAAGVGLHGPEREARLLGDLRVAQPRHDRELDHLTLLGPQLPERPLDAHELGAREELSLGGGVGDLPGGLEIGRLGASPTRAQPVDETAARDRGDERRLAGLLRIVPPSALPHLDEDLLYRVLGVVGAR